MTAYDEVKIGGVGSSRGRVEDARLIVGQGRYVEDVTLPGMLYMSILRSPIAHATIRSIDTSKAWDVVGVQLVLTGAMAAQRNLAWMPTLSYDMQAVLATDKVRFQGQEVACVVADDPYIARDACDLIEVVYDALPPIVNPLQALAPGAPVIRDDKMWQTDNVCYRWEAGDKEATDRAFAAAQVVSHLKLHYPRVHPAPLENTGAVADWNATWEKLTMHVTSHAPHLARTIIALMAELPEHHVRVISPDVGGGFGNDAPVYPGYVCAALSSIITGKPVKWVGDRAGDLMSTAFGRDMYLDAELALSGDGRMLGVRIHADTDNGAFFGDAQPSKFEVGLLHSAFACYNVPAAHLTARGTYTNKAPGGVAYHSGFRAAEAMFLQERMMQVAAEDLGMDPVELRRRNLLRDDQFPHRTAFGFLVDSGQYQKCLEMGLAAIDYENFLVEKAAAKEQGRLLGIGLAVTTGPFGAGNSREFDLLGIKMFESANIRVHPTGRAHLRLGSQPSGGHGQETIYAQVLAHELGIPAGDVFVEYNDTDETPYGAASHVGAGTAMAARKVKAKARKLAAHLLEAHEDDVEWELGRFYVRGNYERGVSIQECGMAAYANMPDGLEPGLEDAGHYDPANLTWPFAVHLVTVEVDAATGVWDVLRVVSVDDYGVRINPAIVEGQIMAGLTEAYAMASMQFLTFDEDGNMIGAGLQDYLVPGSWETPGFELHEVSTPCPHHPIGAKGNGEAATGGAPAAFVNAVLNAMEGHGVRNIDMPLLPDRVWEALTTGKDISGAPPSRTWEWAPERVDAELVAQGALGTA
ncbi:MAG TPA: molybdopterin cofactor-binding domain-containing protein [Sporichthyaceae bacterium]|nr:molybdopterin cofactor-binding domain-containing protein [Sporichthyaceae bacterium]